MWWKFYMRKSFLSKEVLVLLMMLIESGCAIDCFVCDSSVNPGCTNLKSNSSIVAETCTLEKMRTLNTWLFELNAVAYFDTPLAGTPPMRCQKVVAKETENSEPITARFCQLDTRDTDACSILKEQLSDHSKKHYKNSAFIHCSICNTDRCNGSKHLQKDLFLIYFIFVTSLLRLIF